MSITVAKFKDVSEGTQPGQFTIGERTGIASLADLDPVYRRLLDDRSPPSSRSPERTACRT